MVDLRLHGELDAGVFAVYTLEKLQCILFVLKNGWGKNRPPGGLLERLRYSLYPRGVIYVYSTVFAPLLQKIVERRFKLQYIVDAIYLIHSQGVTRHSVKLGHEFPDCHEACKALS